MLAAEHGNAHVCIAKREERFGQAIHFVAKQNADGKARLPIVKVGSMNVCFDGGNFVALLAEPQGEDSGICVMLPGDGFFGAKRGFGQAGMWRAAGNSCQVKLFATGSIGRAKESPDIV